MTSAGGVVHFAAACLAALSGSSVSVKPFGPTLARHLWSKCSPNAEAWDCAKAQYVSCSALMVVNSAWMIGRWCSALGNTQRIKSNFHRCRDTNDLLRRRRVWNGGPLLYHTETLSPRVREGTSYLQRRSRGDLLYEKVDGCFLYM